MTGRRIGAGNGDHVNADPTACDHMISMGDPLRGGGAVFPQAKPGASEEIRTF